jgi:hypothetical protein
MRGLDHPLVKVEEIAGSKSGPLDRVVEGLMYSACEVDGLVGGITTRFGEVVGDLSGA